MGSKSRLKPARIVLDTNTVVSALLFARGRLAWLRHAWQCADFVPVVDRDTASELIRVLGYPKFKLTRMEQEALLGDFLPFAETVPAHAHPVDLPEVRDPDDVKFLALAQHAHVDAVVSGDADLLILRGQWGRIPILTAAEFSDWLKQQP